MAAERDLDIAVFGATGFVGKLTAAELATRAPDGLRIGLAGRSREKLEQVRAELGPRAAEWPLHVADSSDPASLRALAQATRVLITTVGPYRRYGLPVVEACATAGTHYADLTGEVLFMRETVERFDEAARASGARIVHTCGFDSIPSDLGVFLLHRAASEDGAGDLEDTTLYVRKLKGGPSGGTLASLTGQIDEVRKDSALRRAAADPYALSPDRENEPDLGRQSDLMKVVHDDDIGQWLAPFVMAAVNTRVVRRSNALQNWAYGRRFKYREVSAMGSGPLAAIRSGAFAAGLGGFVAGVAFPPTRKVLDRVMPSPGEGPDEETRRNGGFRIETRTRTSSGARYVAHVEAKGDPGYAATSVMLAEAGLCLALDEDQLPKRAGVLTPATAMGMPLVERLRAAGQTLDVERR